jgi:hypothetical protein
MTRQINRKKRRNLSLWNKKILPIRNWVHRADRAKHRKKKRTTNFLLWRKVQKLLFQN